jgi:hypothetical protein
VPTLTDIGAQSADAGDAKASSDTKTSTPKAQTPTYYCLENSHDPRLLTEARMFYFDVNAGCPVCPTCNRQVSAQLVGYNPKGEPQIPANLMALAERIGERV